MPEVLLSVEREGVQVEVRSGERTLHRVGVLSRTQTVERGHRVVCSALLPPEDAEQLARDLLIAAVRARGGGEPLPEVAGSESPRLPAAGGVSTPPPPADRSSALSEA